VAKSNHYSVVRLDNDGNYVSYVSVCCSPTGVAVDANGKVWVTDMSTNTVVRIDPQGGPLGLGAVDLTVNLGSGAAPYNYSDMTGMVAIGTTSPQGTWSVVQDAGIPGSRWGAITWNTEAQGSEPPGTEIVVEARASDAEAGLGGGTFGAVSSGVPLTLAGRFIEVRVTLRAATDGTSPVLSDIRIGAAPPTPTATPIPSATPRPTATPVPSSTPTPTIRRWGIPPGTTAQLPVCLIAVALAIIAVSIVVWRARHR
jgi:hypothetical protein